MNKLFVYLPKKDGFFEIRNGLQTNNLNDTNNIKKWIFFKNNYIL